MLGTVFERFVEKSPISVMVRGTLERVLGAEQLNQWYEHTAETQYTRDLLFSTVYDLMSQVVFRIKPSINAAYRDYEADVGTSVVSVYNKLNGLETYTAAELVRYSAREGYPCKPGHFVASITYRKGLISSPRPGQVIDVR